jgi:hypothetical protein
MSNIDDFWNIFSNRNKIEDFDGSFLFDEWYVKIENQQHYLRLYSTDPVFRKYVVIDQTKNLDLYFLERAVDITNMVNVFWGHPGSGKSDVARAIMKKYLKIKKDLLNEESDHYFTFNPGTFKAKFVEMKPGDYVQLDEWSKTEGQDSQNEMNEIDNILSTSRFSRKCVNLCNPMGIMLLNTTSIFETFGFNKIYVFKLRALTYTKIHDLKKTNELLEKEFNMTLSKASYNKIMNKRKQLLDIMDEKEVEKHLKLNFLDPKEMKTRCLWSTVDNRTGKIFFQGVVVFNIGEELIEDDGYAEAKKKNYVSLESSLGQVGANQVSREKRIKDLAIEFYQYCKEKFGYPRNKENPEKEILKNYIMDFREYKKVNSFGFSTSDEKLFYKQVVIEASNDKNEFKIPESFEKKEIPLDSNNCEEFKYDEDQILDEILKDKINIPGNKVERNIKMFKQLRNPGTTYEMLIKENPELSYRESVDYAINQIKGELVSRRGKLYEKFKYCEYQKYFDLVVYNGEQSQPDFMVKKKETIFFISIKCYDFATKTYDIPQKEHLAEINAAKEYFKKYQVITPILVQVYNCFNKKTYTYQLDNDLIIKKIPLTKYFKQTLDLDGFDKSDKLKEIVSSY